jgi:hypothetical protein
MNCEPGTPPDRAPRFSVRVQLDGQELDHVGSLRERGDKAGEDNVHLVVGAGFVLVRDETGQRQDVVDGWSVAEAREVGHDRHSGTTHGVAALAADGDHLQLALVLDDLLGDEAHGVGVERAGQASIARDQHDQALAFGPPTQ